MRENEQAWPVAGFWRRYAAYAIDSLLTAVPVSVVLAPYDTWSDALTTRILATAPSAVVAQLWAARLEIADVFVGALLAQVVMALPAALCLASPWQATPGKRLFSLVATDAQGQRLGFPRALGRELAKVPAALVGGCGLLAVAWRSDHRGWHDLWAGTAVMKRWPLFTILQRAVADDVRLNR